MSNYLPLRSLSDIETLEGVPLAQRIVEWDFVRCLEAGCDRSPAKPALHFVADGDTAAFRRSIGREHAEGQVLDRETHMVPRRCDPAAQRWIVAGVERGSGGGGAGRVFGPRFESAALHRLIRSVLTRPVRWRA